jgi:LPS-assembly lipoprotein
MFAPKTPTASPARGGASGLGRPGAGPSAPKTPTASPPRGGASRLVPAPGMRRRSLLVALPAAFAGCGFELRRAPEFRFSSIALAGFKRASPLADELKRSIAASTTTRVVEAASQAQVVLEALADARERSVVASTASGQVREITLRTRLGFRLRTPAGKELIAPTELVLTRDMSYNESAALAKEQEEALLFRAMQSDIVAQVMRRLAAVPAV